LIESKLKEISLELIRDVSAWQEYGVSSLDSAKNFHCAYYLLRSPYAANTADDDERAGVLVG